MELGVALNVSETVGVTTEISRRLEEAGLNSLWITDFPAARAAAPLAGAVAESTKECRIGVGLLSPDLYGADQIVRQIQTLEQNFGKRFDVLLGPGDRLALMRIGIALEAGTGIAGRTAEAAIKIRQELQESGFTGRVLLGAQGHRMIAASTKLDGVLLNYSDLSMIRWALDQMKDVPNQFTLGVFPPTWLSHNPNFEATEPIRRAAAMVAVGLAKKPREEFQVAEHVDAGLRARLATGKLGEDTMNAIGDGTLCRFALCANEDDLNSYLRQLDGLGIGLVVFGPPLCTSSEGLEMLIGALGRRGSE